MKNTIQTIKTKTIKDHYSIDTLSDKFFVFDTYSESLDSSNYLIVTDFPVRLDIVIAIICEEGYLSMNIGYNNYKVYKNDFINVLSGRVFQITEISEDFKAKIICLEHGFFDFGNDQNSYDTQNLLREFPLQSLPSSKMELFVYLVDYMKSIIKEKENIYRKRVIYNLLNVLFYEVCNLLINKEESKDISSSAEEIFKRFMKDVEANFSKERNVGFYANKRCLTPKYFSSLIFRLTGKHAKEWIDDYTILEVKAMLKSDRQSVQQISYELNFATPSHFGRYFKHHTGISPRQYRNE